MIQIIPASGQTLIDIALQELGDAARLFEVAQQNNRSITDDVDVEEMLIVPDYSLDRKSIVNLFSNPANRPASGITVSIEDGDDGAIYGEGIEFWGIELDFIIS